MYFNVKDMVILMKYFYKISLPKQQHAEGRICLCSQNSYLCSTLILNVMVFVGETFAGDKVVRVGPSWMGSVPLKGVKRPEFCPPHKNTWAFMYQYKGPCQTPSLPTLLSWTSNFY